MPALAESAAVTPSTKTLPLKTVVRTDAKSGRLVRTVVAPPASKIAPAELNEMVSRIADQQGVEVPLVHSVILAESNYNPSAVSPKGAQGIMQLIPSTARRFGVTNAFDAEDNIQGGVRYLRFLLDYYNGDYTKAIAAYNAGEAAVDKFHGVPPFAETLGYVRTVSQHLTVERRQYQHDAQPKGAAAVVPAGSPDAPRHIEIEIGADGLAYFKTP